MLDSASDNDGAMEMLERQWVAAHRAAQDARAECESLREMCEWHDAAWRRARARQRQLEILCRQLSSELGHAELAPSGPASPGRKVRAAEIFDAPQEVISDCPLAG
jgi:hypothetical protein